MYIIYGNHIKAHFCDNYYLAQQVAENLRERFHNKTVTIAQSKEDNFRFDLGGSLVSSDKKFEIPCGTIRVIGYKCHWIYFYLMINQLKSEKYDNKFFKLHSEQSVLCLSPETYEAFKSHVEICNNLGMDY